MLACELQGGKAIRRDGRFVAGVADDPQGQLEVVGFVLYHEDLRHSSPRSGLMRGEREVQREG